MSRKATKIVLIATMAVLCIIGGTLAFDYFWEMNNIPEYIDAPYEAREDLDNTAPTESEILAHIVAPDRPRYMSISRIGVNNARVMELGTVGGSNQLADPVNVHDVGWYHGSARPGQPEPHKMAGLYDGHNTGMYSLGVFYRLGELVYGDQIVIERGDGAVFTYSVRESSLVAAAEVNMAMMMQTAVAGVEGLNIITCGGNWDEVAQTYTHRVLIRAILI